MSTKKDLCAECRRLNIGGYSSERKGAIEAKLERYHAEITRPLALRAIGVAAIGVLSADQTRDIFAFLEDAEDLARCRAVCRGWRAIVPRPRCAYLQIPTHEIDRFKYGCRFGVLRLVREIKSNHRHYETCFNIAAHLLKFDVMRVLIAEMKYVPSFVREIYYVPRVCEFMSVMRFDLANIVAASRFVYCGGELPAIYEDDPIIEEKKENFMKCCHDCFAGKFRTATDAMRAINNKSEYARTMAEKLITMHSIIGPVDPEYYGDCMIHDYYRGDLARVREKIDKGESIIISANCPFDEVKLIELVMTTSRGRKLIYSPEWSGDIATEAALAFYRDRAAFIAEYAKTCSKKKLAPALDVIDHTDRDLQTSLICAALDAGRWLNARTIAQTATLRAADGTPIYCFDVEEVKKHAPARRIAKLFE